jgi:hypothetical protein
LGMALGLADEPVHLLFLGDRLMGLRRMTDW